MFVLHAPGPSYLQTEGGLMSIYVMLINYTEQGIRNIKSSPKRADAARFLAKSCGTELKDLYLTMGQYGRAASPSQR